MAKTKQLSIHAFVNAVKITADAYIEHVDMETGEASDHIADEEDWWELFEDYVRNNGLTYPK